MIGTPYQIWAGWSNQEAYAGWGTWHAWVRGQVQVGFWRGNLKVKRPLGRPRRERESGLTMCLQELGWERGMDSFGSGMGRVAGCCDTVMNLLVPYNAISWQDKELLASQKGHCSTELKSTLPLQAVRSRTSYLRAVPSTCTAIPKATPLHAPPSNPQVC